MKVEKVELRPTIVLEKLVCDRCGKEAIRGNDDFGLARASSHPNAHAFGYSPRRSPLATRRFLCLLRLSAQAARLWRASSSLPLEGVANHWLGRSLALYHQSVDPLSILLILLVLSE